MRSRRVLLFTLVALVCACAAYAGFQPSQAAAPLSTYAPQGALLAIESPDFAALLRDWSNSNEQKRWLASDDYAGFSRSRLFGRLSEAQDQFATTAGRPANSEFLYQIAGTETLLAWYDIGKLEFLYITRMPSGEAESSPLFKLRSRFEERRVGETTFYVRHEEARTVAFAARGDYLLLATNEDLIAGALGLMQKPADRTLNTESWYAGTVAVAARNPGDLRMTLNIARIVPSPYFRSYWVQQNITDMKQYSAALSDLYREKNRFREDRVLLPARTNTSLPTADLGPLLAYLPPDRGIYRAQAGPSAAEIVAQLDDKLLSRLPSSYRDRRVAPVADLQTPQVGYSADLEDLIDEPMVVPEPRSIALRQLTKTIATAQPSSMLVFSSAVALGEQADRVFAPMHSAVVLTSPQGWDPSSLQDAITGVLAQTISISPQGLSWESQRSGPNTWSELTGLNRLTVALDAKNCIIASDRETLLELLEASRISSHTPQVAHLIGGFNHITERAPFVHLTNLIDSQGHPTKPTPGTPPPFFSGNLASITESFSDLAAETVTEAPLSGHGTRQTVVYQWR
jgi:hypothetical protein